MAFFSFINPLKWNYTWRLYKCLFQLSWRACYCIIVIRNLCTKLLNHSLYHLSGIAFGDVFLHFFFVGGLVMIQMNIMARALLLLND